MGGLRLYPMERVRDELAFILTKLRPRYLRILDAYLGGTRSRALDILRHIARHNRGTEVQVFHDVRFVDREYLLACEAARALTLWSGQEYGLQSLSEEALALVGRRQEGEAFRRAMEELRSFFEERGHRFDATAELIVGLPGETYRSFVEGALQAVRSGAEHVRCFPLLVLPGTRLYEEAEALGIRHADRGSFRVIETPTLRTSDLQRALHFGSFIEMVGRALPTEYRVLCDTAADRFEPAFDAYLTLTPDREPHTFDTRRVAQALHSLGLPGLDGRLEADLKGSGSLRSGSRGQGPTRP
jgi:radical SAM superfamily enzyme YgiQ (UPF0313 family)